ncbi:hypothetical protein Barb6_00538 [Bacteroidales bacterium Barb6]|nr:hypothetical protein Barb6_00538 [Bacteroidales bacterium Barb6]
MIKFKRLVCTLTAVLCVWAAGAQNDAQLSVDESIYNFGAVSESDGAVTHVFVLKNTGKAPLAITRVTASCGCTRPEYPQEPIAPGKTGELKITFDPAGHPGLFYKTISVYSNGKLGSYSLAVKGEVKPKVLQPVLTYPYSIGGLKLHTKTILFNAVRSGEVSSERIDILNDTQTPLSVCLGKSSDYFMTEVTPAALQPGQKGEIIIKLSEKAADQKGRVAAELSVTVAVAGQKEITGQIQLAANLIDNFSKLSATEKAQAPEASLSSTILEFGQLSAKEKSIIPLVGGKVTVAFDITNTGKSPLLIYSVTSDDRRLDISGGKRELKPGASTTVKVTLRPKDIKTRMESLVNIVCNDPNGPVRLIKVTAYR